MARHNSSVVLPSTHDAPAVDLARYSPSIPTPAAHHHVPVPGTSTYHPSLSATDALNGFVPGPSTYYPSVPRLSNHHTPAINPSA